MNRRLLSHGLVLAVGVAGGLLVARPWRSTPPEPAASHSSPTGETAVASAPRQPAPKIPAKDADGEVRALSAAEALVELAQSARERNWDKRAEAIRKIIKGVAARD